MTAWPRLMPPSLHGTREWVRTRKPRGLQAGRGGIQQEHVLEHAAGQGHRVQAVALAQQEAAGLDGGRDPVVEAGGDDGGTNPVR